MWNREVGITGLVITKLDGTARGGVVVSIVRDVGVPVKLIGVGEGISDLRDFDPEVFVDALLGYEVSLTLLCCTLRCICLTHVSYMLTQPEKAAALEARLQGMVKDKLIKPKGGVITAPLGGGRGPNSASDDDIQDRMRRRVQGRGGQGGSKPRGGKSGGGGGKRKR